MTNERILLERAKHYDEAALGELYDCYAPRIYAYVYRRVSDARVAEDITADVFVRVLQAIQSDRFWHTCFQSWLYRIAHNLVVDHYRRRSGDVTETEWEEGTVVSEDDPVATVETRLVQQRLDVALRCLTPDQQQVLALRFGEGMSTRQVAEVVDKTVGAIEALQHRALATLRRVLEKEIDANRGVV